MAKFSVEGDEDGNEEEPRRLPKKPRTSFDPIAHTPNKPLASTSTSNSGASAPASTSTTPLLHNDDDDDSTHDKAIDLDNLGKELSTYDVLLDLDNIWEQLCRRGGDWIQAGVLPVNLSPNGNGKGTKSAEPLSLTLTDSDVLDCEICFEPLNPPVYQCENGHIACTPCCTNMNNKCGSCSMPIGYNRCRAIEKVIESIQISCPNTQYGCTASLNYSQKLDHERKCYYAPCSCPYPECTYVGLSSSVYSHFAAKHANSSKIFFYDKALSISLESGQNHAFLQTGSLNTLFVLSRCTEPRGSFVNVVWISPASSELRFSYEVSATDGISSVKLNAVAEVTPQLSGQPLDKTCLFVPNGFVTSGVHLKLELTISRDTVL